MAPGITTDLYNSPLFQHQLVDLSLPKGHAVMAQKQAVQQNINLPLSTSTPALKGFRSTTITRTKVCGTPTVQPILFSPRKTKVQGQPLVPLSSAMQAYDKKKPMSSSFMETQGEEQSVVSSDVLSVLQNQPMVFSDLQAVVETPTLVLSSQEQTGRESMVGGGPKKRGSTDWNRYKLGRSSNKQMKLSAEKYSQDVKSMFANIRGKTDLEKEKFVQDSNQKYDAADETEGKQSDDREEMDTQNNNSGEKEKEETEDDDPVENKIYEGMLERLKDKVDWD